MWWPRLRYGIGQHAKQAQDTGRGDMLVQPPALVSRLSLDELDANPALAETLPVPAMERLDPPLVQEAYRTGSTTKVVAKR